MKQKCYAGIDIGGTKVAVALGASNGKIIESVTLPMDIACRPEEVLSRALDSLYSLATSHDVEFSGVGICCAGPLDIEAGEVDCPPNLPLWKRFAIVDLVERAMKLPVALENDANAAALGEALYGAGIGLNEIIYLTISTGIGSGFISNGELVHRYGEAGHIIVDAEGPLCGCGGRGCLEAICSGTAIVRRYNEQVAQARQANLFSEFHQVDGVTAQVVVDAAKKGDAIARKVWDETVSFLSLGIANMITMTGPQAVILGGGVALGAGEFLLEPLRTNLKGLLKLISIDDVQILNAKLGGNSGLCGAIALISRSLGSAC